MAIVISIIGIGLSPWFWLPLGLTQALSALIYFALGDALRQMFLSPPKRTFLLPITLIWIVAFLVQPYVGFGFVWPLIWLSILGATCATVCLCAMSTKLENTKSGRLLEWCGRNSMGIYCSHALCFGIVYWLSGEYGKWAPWGENLCFLFHLVVCLILTFLASKTRGIKTIFQLA